MRSNRILERHCWLQYLGRGLNVPKFPFREYPNLTVAPDGNPTANSIMLKVLDQIYVESPLR